MARTVPYRATEGKRATVGRMSATPTIVPLRRTGGSGSGADRDAWIRSRHAALVAELVRRGMDRSQAWSLAMAPVAHWGDETGWGRAEYGFNIGNIRAVGQCPNAHLLQGGDDAVPRPYCDYPSLEAGVSATLNLILAPRYAAGWSRFVADGDAVGWFDRLLRAGWHPWSQASVDSFRSEYARVQRTVGAMPPSSSGTGMGAVVAILAIAAGATGYVLLSDD